MGASFAPGASASGAFSAEGGDGDALRSHSAAIVSSPALAGKPLTFCVWGDQPQEPGLIAQTVLELDVVGALWDALLLRWRRG